MRKVKALLTVTVLALAACAFTCHKAANISHGVAVSINDLQAAEISLHQVGKVTDEEHQALQQGFKEVAQADIAIRKCIAASGAPGCVDAGIDEVNNLLNSKVTGIKNPDSRQQIQLLGQGLVTALTALKAAL